MPRDVVDFRRTPRTYKVVILTNCVSNHTYGQIKLKLRYIKLLWKTIIPISLANGGAYSTYNSLPRHLVERLIRLVVCDIYIIITT